MSCESTDSEETIYQLKRIGSPATLMGVADRFTVEKDITLIGRAKAKVQFYMDSLKNKGLISRIHARIFRSKTKSGQYVFKICDTSLNGTYVNNVKILNESALLPGDTIAFGHLQGAALQAGKTYSQPNSEFCFKFEKLSAFEVKSPEYLNRSTCISNIDEDTKKQENATTGDVSPSTDFRTPKYSSHCPDLSVFLETPTSTSLENNNYSKICPTKRELGKNFMESDNETYESDFDILREYASAASLAAEMQNESDEELFSVKYTTLLPGGAVSKAKDSGKVLKTQRKRRKSWKLQESSAFKATKSKKLSTNKDGCQAVKCFNPTENIISWVQCDDCDQWYHVKCVGLSLNLVKPKNAKFHCGCS